MSDAANKPVALVTGAAQGIGAAISRALGEAGFAVMMADLEEDLVHQTAAAFEQLGMEAAAIRLDVVRSAQWASAVAAIEKRWGGLDVLVNNAGISSRGTV